MKEKVDRPSPRPSSCQINDLPCATPRRRSIRGRKGGRKSLSGPACHRRFRSEASDWNLGSRGGRYTRGRNARRWSQALARWEMLANTSFSCNGAAALARLSFCLRPAAVPKCSAAPFKSERGVTDEPSIHLASSTHYAARALRLRGDVRRNSRL